MPEKELHILSAGLVCSVGLSMSEAAASVRAGTARFQQTQWVDRSGDFMTFGGIPKEAFPPLPESFAG